MASVIFGYVMYSFNLYVLFLTQIEVSIMVLFLSFKKSAYSAWDNFSLNANRKEMGAFTHLGLYQYVKERRRKSLFSVRRCKGMTRIREIKS